MKTIKELIEEKGRGVIERMIEMINETPQAHTLLSAAGKDIINAILKDGGVQLLLENGSWVTVEWGIGGQPLQTHRIRKDYKLPKDEPEVFWGKKENQRPRLHLCPYYSCSDGKYFRWDKLAGWAEENGWEFHGFCTIKGGGKMSSRPYLPFYCQDDGKVCVRPFAKFVKKTNNNN